MDVSDREDINHGGQKVQEVTDATDFDADTKEDVNMSDE